MKRRSSGKGGHEAGKPPSQRQLRVGELIRHALAGIFSRGDIQDPVLSGVILSVSEVRMSPDLRNASVFVVALGQQDQRPVLEALSRATRFLKGEVAREVTLRHMPDLRFVEDTSFDYAENVEGILRSSPVIRDLRGGEEEE